MRTTRRKVQSPRATHRRAPSQECPWDLPRTRLLCSFAAAFLQACKARLCALLEQQEENCFFNVKEWVSREASNQDALQEAGTFRYRDEGQRGPCCGGGARAPRPWMIRPLLLPKVLSGSEQSRVFPKRCRMVWVMGTWGLLDSSLHVCMLAFCHNSNKDGTPVLAGGQHWPVRLSHRDGRCFRLWGREGKCPRPAAWLKLCDNHRRGTRECSFIIRGPFSVKPCPFCQD